jgi:ribosomal protein S1
VHISELANFRVKQTEDIVKIGDENLGQMSWRR